MDDLNDLAYFAAVVEHGGFSAAARATGIEKTVDWYLANRNWAADITRKKYARERLGTGQG